MEVLLAAGALALILGLIVLLRGKLGSGDRPVDKLHKNTNVDQEMAQSQMRGNDFTNFSG